MKIYILICAIILQVGWSYGEPRGVGAYAYEDSSGNSRFSDLGLGAFSGLQSPAMNRAYAGGAVGPDFTHQVAGISPNNPNVPNVNVMTRFADANNPGDGGFYSVSSSSFVSSSNIDGKEQSHRKAETMVNRNGQITKYKVES